MTVVTCHVGSEASAVGRRGVPKVPVRCSEREPFRVCSTRRVGGGGAAGGGTSTAALGHVQGVPVGQPRRQQQHVFALHLGTELR